MTYIEPCCKCGWKYGGFHVCIIDKRTPAGRRHAEQVLGAVQTPNGGTKVGGRMTEEQKARIAESQRKRWADKKNKAAQQEVEICERYKAGGVGIITLSKEYKISRDKVLRILHKAQDAGYLTMRPRGVNIANGAR